MTVITNPSTYNSVLTQSGTGIFDNPDTTANQGVLPLQVLTSQPTLPTLEQQTNMVSADRSTSERMTHFDPDLYDVRDVSHLSRFMRALLGDAGVGQLHKRYTMTRLESTLDGTNFYDLDGFYGSIFSIPRRPGEVLPVDPMASNATPDQWDAIMSSDAAYRERIKALAASLPMAGTVDGIRAAAEAITEVECDVYETWLLIESGYTSYVGLTYGQVEAYGTYGALESLGAYGDVSEQSQVGQAGVVNYDEVFIRPKKDYAGLGTPRAIAQAKAMDVTDVSRVLDKIKPAGVLMTVQSDGIALNLPVKVAGLYADSENWEVVRKVTPTSLLDDADNPYLQTAVVAPVANNGQPQLMPIPPYSASQRYEWYYNAAIGWVYAYEYKEYLSLETGDYFNPYSPTDNGLKSRVDWDTIPPPIPSGHSVAFIPGWGLADPLSLVTSHTSMDSVLQAHPYSGSRSTVNTHG